MKKHRRPLTRSGTRSRARFDMIREHRRVMLDRALELVLSGKEQPSYITYRAKKYKEVA